jgi:hypothetical protein
LTALERDGQIAIEEATHASPLVISPAASDRLVSKVRLVALGGTDVAAASVQRYVARVPVGIFGDRNDPPPGSYTAVSRRVS